jgi:Rps23 Pro-64 3,4-dihydroxylase Tpa1-like proline 4-hydroxylase
VLPRQEFAALFSYLNSMEYHSVHARGWRKVWRLHDGDPLTSKPLWLYPDPPNTEADEWRYPTGTALDALVGWIGSRAPEVENVIGRGGSDWGKLSVAPWIYPPGSGLSLHQDGLLYTGAFTFFAHPEWRIHWGGHLLVLDATTAPIGSSSTGGVLPPFLSDDHESERALNPGLALTVFAKPNRIVFLAPTAQHLLTRVDVNAGQHPRVSVAGFFHKASRS